MNSNPSNKRKLSALAKLMSDTREEEEIKRRKTG
jgi:hypothetical protein